MNPGKEEPAIIIEPVQEPKSVPAPAPFEPAPVRREKEPVPA